MALPDINKEPWWRFPADQIRLAYYMTLRIHYCMGAQDALRMVNKNHADYPEFFMSPMPTLRKALQRSHVEDLPIHPALGRRY
jgi:hypothetical protein